MSESEAASWLDALWKGLSGAVLGVFAWAWNLSRQHAVLKEQFRLMEISHQAELKMMKDKLNEIDRGVRRVLDHLTGTKLHGGED